MWWRVTIFLSCGIIAGAIIAHFRSETSYRPTIAAESKRDGQIRMSSIAPGGGTLRTGENTHEESDGYDVNEGKRLYKWFNCNGCHANGGGDIGPALMDDKWIYGSDALNVYKTIVEGRPNGMPSFRDKIPDAQVWQIVAYVRSMSGLVPFYSRPGRDDSLQSKIPEIMTHTEGPHQAQAPRGPNQ